MSKLWATYEQAIHPPKKWAWRSATATLASGSFPRKDIQASTMPGLFMNDLRTNYEQPMATPHNEDVRYETKIRFGKDTNKKNEDNQQGSKIDPFPECATRRGIVSAARARAPRSRAPPLVPGRPRRFGQKAHRWKSFDSRRLRASTVSAVANTASAATSKENKTE